MKVTFAEQLVQLIRREFFAGVPDKQFFQERNLLLQAVTYPADWLHRRGAKLQEPPYRQILQTVIDTIKAHGNRAKIRRFSAYFLHAVQTHMQHHGEEYYQASKRLPAAGAVVPEIVGELRAGDSRADVIGVLLEVRRTLRSRGGRKKTKRESATDGDLFAQGSVRSPVASD
jgi:hypothetical protein